MNWLDPRAWLALIIWTAAVAFFADHRATKIERTAGEARELKISNDAKDKKIAADAESKAQERKLAAAFDQRIAQTYKDQANEKAAADRLIADLRNRNKRLSIPVTDTFCRVGTDGSSPAAAGSGAEGRSDITPGAAEFLARLAERGDNAIRKHATLVDLYNDLRNACMNPIHQP